MKANRVWLWLIPLSLLWPAVHLIVFWIRFGNPTSTGIIRFLDFLPMSSISGIIFLVLWERTAKRKQKIDLLLGYLFASPIAFLGSLLSGLVYASPIIGTLIWGVGPLLGGMLLGLLVSYILTKTKPG